MELIKLKKSDLSITPLAFGAWAIGGWIWGGGITCVLAGARNPEQIIENAGAMSFTLTEDEMNFISGELAELNLETSPKT